MPCLASLLFTQYAFVTGKHHPTRALSPEALTYILQSFLVTRIVQRCLPVLIFA